MLIDQYLVELFNVEALFNVVIVCRMILDCALLVGKALGLLLSSRGVGLEGSDEVAGEVLELKQS